MIYSAIKKNQKLADKRHPMFEKNKFAKYLAYFMVAFWACYLILFGCTFPSMFRGIAPNMEPYHILNTGMIFVFLTDFLLRFIFQKVPVQEIKPYLLFPVKKNTILNCFLIQSGLNIYNLFWMFMLVPFAFLTIFKFYGFIGVIGFLLCYWILFIANNYWYLLCRTLINERILYVLLPAFFYGLLGCAMFIPKESPVFEWSMNFGEGFILWNPICLLTCILLVLFMFWLNMKIQARLIYNELSKKQDTKLRTVSEFKIFDRYGIIGEYLRLEIKSHLRNKLVKTQFRTGLFIMLAFSAALSFTEVYDGAFMTSFICIYNLAVLGIMTLTQIMCPEGRYMDGLMSRKESILSLLKAKYYFNCVIVLIPLLLMIFPICKGKITVLMALSYFFFTTGVIFFTLFQLAVYNKNAVDPNTKIIGKNRGGTYYQQLIAGLAFFIPVALDAFLRAIFSETVSLWILLISGILFTFGNDIWMRNIYKRLMKRRYVNMEGFRETR